MEALAFLRIRSPPGLYGSLARINNLCGAQLAGGPVDSIGILEIEYFLIIRLPIVIVVKSRMARVNFRKKVEPEIVPAITIHVKVSESTGFIDLSANNRRTLHILAVKHL